MTRTACHGSVLSIFLLLVVVSARAQTPEPGPVIKISTDLVVLDVLALRRETGLAVDGLRAEDFEVYEDGVKQEVTYFSRDQLPLSVVLLLDVSGSMRPALARLRLGALQALSHLKPEDEVALLAFATDTGVIQGFTRDRRLIAEKIAVVDWVQLGGGTYLNEALLGVSEKVLRAANPVNRRVVIVITDDLAAVLRAGREDPQKAAIRALLESAGVVCGLVVPGDPRGRPILMGGSQGGVRVTLKPIKMEDYAAPTGGLVVKARPNDLDLKLAEMIDRLRARYSLGYLPANTRSDGGFRRLAVTLSPGVKERGGELVVRTRQGYYARGQE